MTPREEIERRVDELAARHRGKAFALAIRTYSTELDAVDQETLKDVVMERAANVDQAVMERVDARGWFRRQWDRAGSPPER